ncbi:MAG TPA: dicarboxylate/amino acid:cation symporter [Cytophagales bacterium]|nr:dicarboxylate/amino acid:cation symporter [Cytophagales bacterium]HAP59240.1 dicarboxylate/amino acid:cation symporter [Cytophagales bacterium]
MKNIPLHWRVIIGLLLGTIYAYLSIQFGWNDFTLNYIQPFGDIFINLLKLIAVPLVLFSIISGVASMKDVNKLGRMGGKTLVAYLATTVFSVGVGLILVNTFKPGVNVDDDLRTEMRIDYELWLAEEEAAGNYIPRLDDINYLSDPAYADQIAAVKARRSTEEVDDNTQDKLDKAARNSEKGPLQPLVDVVPDNFFGSLVDAEMLQVIFFAIFFGVVLVGLPEDKAGPVMRGIDGLNDIFVKMVMIVMNWMPIFVFALMAGQIVKAAGADSDKFFSLLDYLWKYGATLILGLALMVFLVYPTVITTFVKKMSFGRFISRMRDAQITAFSTSSSVATLPVTMKTVHEKMGVSKRISSFVLPIGATVNMDGTSMYQAIAVVSMAQLHMVDLTLGQQLTIIITASLASIGAAAVPSAGLVLMIVVLESVGLNPVWIALIIPVDRILDMCRTVVNVTGDATVSTLIASSEKELEVPEKVSVAS